MVKKISHRGKIALLLAAALLLALIAYTAATPRVDDQYREAVCAYLTEHTRRDTDEVTIPCPVIYKIVDGDKSNILVWGTFQSYSYALRSTTMMVGGTYLDQGVMHLKAVDGGYAVTDFEIFGDVLTGEGYLRDVFLHCVPDIGLMARIMILDLWQRETARLDSLRHYAAQNGLKITQYQYYGWAPEAIPGMPETTEEEQIVHFESDLGYNIDYDLRALSFLRYDDSSESFSSVEEFNGYFLQMERYRDQSFESVLETVEKALIGPVYEQAVIGADDIEVTLLRDGYRDDGAMYGSYVVPLEGGDYLVVTVSNAYYAFPNDPVIPGADAVLTSVLASFRLR